MAVVGLSITGRCLQGAQGRVCTWRFSLSSWEAGGRLKRAWILRGGWEQPPLLACASTYVISRPPAVLCLAQVEGLIQVYFSGLASGTLRASVQFRLEMKMGRVSLQTGLFRLLCPKWGQLPSPGLVLFLFFK